MNIKISTRELHYIFMNSLGNGVISSSTIEYRPLNLNLKPPLPHKIRLYIYNLTHPPGGRTLGEHKIQIILPGHSLANRCEFDDSDGRIVILAGYDYENRVFVLWDAGLYRNIPFSRNVQVKAQTVYAAIAGNIGTQERIIKGIGKEIVLASPQNMLHKALQLRVHFTLQRVIGAS